MKFKSDIEVQAGLRDSSGAIGSSGQILSSTGTNVSWVNQSTIANDVQNQVKAGVAINKGQAVYVTGADGTNIIVGLASNASEATSSKTLGLLNATVAINGMADVVQIGRLSGLNTLGATAGDPVWLGTGGNLIYGLIGKPYAPANLVFIGVVTRVNVSNGEIFVNVQNGFELNEIHDVDLKTVVPVNGDILGYNGTLWVNKTIAGWLGYTPANASGTVNYVSKFTGTTTLGNSQIYDNGTNVGIGTTSPSYKLSVVTSSTNGLFINTSGSDFGNPSIAMLNGSTDSTISATSNGLEITTYSSHPMLFRTNTSERMRILANGNVGIGTTSPSYKFQTASSVNSDWVGSFYNTSTTTPNGLQVRVGVSSAAQALGVYTDGIGYTFSVLGNGNVGIGVTNPANRLETYLANGAQDNNLIIRQGSANFSSNAVLVAANDTGSVWNSISSSTSSGTEHWRIDAGGVVDSLAFTTGGGTGDIKMRISPTGDVGINVNVPTQRLHVVGNARITGGIYDSSNAIGTSGQVLSSTGAGTSWVTPTTGTITGSGTTNYVTKFTGSSSIGNSQLFDNGTNVGIGTTSPISKLHTTGTTTIGSGVFSSSGTMQLLTGGASPISNRITYSTDGTGWKFAIGKNQAGTVTDQFVIQDNGNVGIGTTSPVSIGSYTTLDLRGTNGSLLYMGQSGATASLRLIGEGTDGYIDNINISGSLLFRTNAATERMRITLGGNVGIGTSTPAYKLDVNGGGAFRDTLRVVSSGTDVAYLSWTSANTGVLSLLSGGSVNAQILASGNSYFNGGNVGIGTASPAYKLHVNTTDASANVIGVTNGTQTLALGVNNSSGGSFLFENSNSALRFGTNGSERMRITAAGDVGIGTTSPSYKLDVTGDIRAYNGTLKLDFTPNSGGLRWSLNPYLSGVSNTGFQIYDETNGASRLAINYLGNVGIGTTSPTQVLHVAGNARITGAVYDSSNSAGSSGQVLSSTGTGTAWVTGGGGGGISGSGTTNYIPKFTGSTAVGNSVIYESGGSIGIGTTSPSAKLHVAGAQILDDGAGRITFALGSAQNEIYSTTTGFAAYSNLRISANSTIFTNAGAEVMRITSLGNIGIGTSTPGASLDVQGTFNASNLGATLNVSSSQAYAGYQGNYDFSYAGGSYSSINGNDGQAFIQSYSAAYARSPKLGIQAFNSNTGDQDFLVAKHLIQNSFTPSDPYTPVKWIRIWDEDTGAFFYMPMYQ